MDELAARSTARGTDQDAPRGPLDGVLVADFSRVLAGPLATMLLGDLGATVVKVESPAGDETRTWTPPQHEGTSTYYLSVNRNKQSVVLDLTDPDDLAAARELAARADVLVENMKPGTMDRFGLGYDAVSATNPGVVYASVTGFGTAGGRDLPGYDLLVQAMSGIMSLQGDADGSPYRAGVAIFDVVTGLHTAIAIMTGLYERERSGRGQRVDLNLMASAMSGLVNQSGGYALTGRSPWRMGNEHPSIYPYAPLPTGDGDIVLAIGNDRQFTTLCDVLGVPGLPLDERFATNPLRSANRDALRPLLVDALAGRTAAEWFDVLTEHRLPCAPILDVAGGVAMAQRLGLDPVVPVGPQGQPGIRNPLTFSRTPASYRRAAPGLDADGDRVRAWLAAPRGTQPPTDQPAEPVESIEPAEPNEPTDQPTTLDEEQHHDR